MIILAATNPSGIEGANLTHALQRGCSVCDGVAFHVSATTPNAGAKGVEGLYYLCIGCGTEELIDFETMGATADYV